MRRVMSWVFCCALLGAFATRTLADERPQWATIKGQVVFPKDKEIPKRAKLDVTQDKDHCLKNGDILDESILVNSKNRGVKNVVVYLRPDANTLAFAKGQIHPDDAKRKSAEIIIDQPCCMFIKRVTVARVGDTIVVKNSAPVSHNFFWNSAESGNHNPNIAANTDWKMPNDLGKETGPIEYKCTIHPWMKGHVRVFDHPYYALTDEDGKFEIKNVPVGKLRIVYWHENPGLRGGGKGRAGEEIEVKGPTLEMKPVEFDVSPK